MVTVKYNWGKLSLGKSDEILFLERNNFPRLKFSPTKFSPVFKQFIGIICNSFRIGSGLVVWCSINVKRFVLWQGRCLSFNKWYWNLTKWYYFVQYVRKVLNEYILTIFGWKIAKKSVTDVRKGKQWKGDFLVKSSKS